MIFNLLGFNVPRELRKSSSPATVLPWPSKKPWRNCVEHYTSDRGTSSNLHQQNCFQTQTAYMHSMFQCMRRPDLTNNNWSHLPISTSILLNVLIVLILNTFYKRNPDDLHPLKSIIGVISSFWGRIYQAFLIVLLEVERWITMIVENL